MKKKIKYHFKHCQKIFLNENQFSLPLKPNSKQKLKKKHQKIVIYEKNIEFTFICKQRT